MKPNRVASVNSPVGRTAPLSTSQNELHEKDSLDPKVGHNLAALILS